MTDELTGALIGLARATESAEPAESTYNVLFEGLAAGYRNDSEDTVHALTETVREEKYKLVPSCRYCASPCGRTNDYDMNLLQEDTEEVRTMKLQILAGIQELAHIYTSTQDPIPRKQAMASLLFEALFKIGYEDTTDELLPLLQRISN